MYPAVYDVSLGKLSHQFFLIFLFLDLLSFLRSPLTEFVLESSLRALRRVADFPLRTAARLFR